MSDGMQESNEKCAQSAQDYFQPVPTGSADALRRIVGKLRRAGATLPAPQVTGTIEDSVVTGLCIALAIVEGEMNAKVHGTATEPSITKCEYTDGNCTRGGCDTGCQAMELARQFSARIPLEADASPDRVLDSKQPPFRISTAWGDFWAIGDRTARIFLSEEEAAAAMGNAR